MSQIADSQTMEFSSIPEVMKITESAALKVYELMEEEGDLNLKLRVSITGGGCSGFQYHFAFDQDVKKNDMVIEKKWSVDAQRENKVQVLVDAISLQYLAQAEIDYVEDMEGARFIIRNPNASTTCGCGSSFSV